MRVTEIVLSPLPNIGDRPIRGAIFGTGGVATQHVEAWHAIPGVEIVALAYRTKSGAVAIGSGFGIDDTHTYNDYRELLRYEDVDFIDIATAPDAHRERVLAAAEAGRRVTCQEPFAATAAQAIGTVEERGTKRVRLGGT